MVFPLYINKANSSQLSKDKEGLANGVIGSEFTHITVNMVRFPDNVASEPTYLADVPIRPDIT